MDLKIVAVHATISLGSTIEAFMLSPSLLGSKKSKLRVKKCRALAGANFISIFTMSAATALTPVEIIAPELAINWLKMDKWSERLPESNGKKTGEIYQKRSVHKVMTNRPNEDNLPPRKNAL